MGTFLLLNINYIPSFAFIDAIVHCNVPNVWNSALWACAISGAPMGPILHVSTLVLHGVVLHPGRQWCGVAQYFGQNGGGEQSQRKDYMINHRIKQIPLAALLGCGPTTQQ